MRIKLTFAITALLVCHLLNAQIVITEVMFNPPEAGIDTLEYIELYNNGNETINLSGYQFTQGVRHTFGQLEVNAGEYIVLAIDSTAMKNIYNITAYQWEEDGLRNGGESITLVDPLGMVVDGLSYSDQEEWPTDAAGLGASMELCDITKDNSEALNWKASATPQDVIINGLELRGTPGKSNSVICDGAKLIVTEVLNVDNIGVGGFVEVMNIGNVDLPLGGISILGDIEGTFADDDTLKAQEIMILSNTPDNYVLDDTKKVQISYVNSEFRQFQLVSGSTIFLEFSFNVEAPWPDVHFLTSIQICDLTGDMLDPNNWSASVQPLGDFIANPGEVLPCNFTIEDLKKIDVDGISTVLGNNVAAEGIVYGFNLRSSGVQFVIIDESGNGIGVFNDSQNFGYTVAEGDRVSVQGVVRQFNGYTQIAVTDITLISEGNTLLPSQAIVSISEEDESELISIENVQLVDPTQWRPQGSGFRVDVTNGTDTIEVWIDADVDIYNNRGYPTGTFTITGIGSQFDPQLPYTEGYQIRPRYKEDIDPYIPFETEFPRYIIEEVINEDANGAADSLGVVCALTGVVYGINLRPSGLQFTLIDEDGNGIGVFNNNNNHGYTVTEGDYVTVQGSIDQFNGLTQIVTDNVTLIRSDEALADPLNTIILDETTESKLIRITNLTFVDPTQWIGNGSSFNVDIMNGLGEIFSMRIDGDVELSNASIPGQPFDLTGIGSQFDTSSPYSGGYQILPRYADDIDVILTTNDLISTGHIEVYPNPVIDVLNIKTSIDLEMIQVFDKIGRMVLRTGNISELDVSPLRTGLYILVLTKESKSHTIRFFKD